MESDRHCACQIKFSAHVGIFVKKMAKLANDIHFGLVLCVLLLFVVLSFASIDENVEHVSDHSASVAPSVRILKNVF